MDLKNGFVRLPDDVMHLNGYASLAGPSLGAAGASYLDIADGGGWTFRATPDGNLKIIEGPSGVGVVYAPGSAQYEAVLARLRARDPRIDSVLTSAVPVGSDSSSSFVAGLLDQLGVGVGPGTTEAEAAADPAVVQEQKGKVGAMIASLLSQYGPAAATALQTAVQNRTQGLVALQTQVAKKRAQYASATKPVKRAKLGAEIAGLEAQIRRLYATQAGAQAQLQAPPPRQGVPSWLPWVIGGTLLVGGIITVAARK